MLHSVHIYVSCCMAQFARGGCDSYTGWLHIVVGRWQLKPHSWPGSETDDHQPSIHHVYASPSAQVFCSAFQALLYALCYHLEGLLGRAPKVAGDLAAAHRQQARLR